MRNINKLDSGYADKCLDMGDLDESCRLLPTQIGEWANGHAAAAAEVIITKLRIKDAWARAVAEEKQRMEDAGEKVVAKAAEQLAETSQAVHAATNRHAEAVRKKVWCAGVLAGLLTKRDMVVGQGATQRKEMEYLSVTVRDSSPQRNMSGDLDDEDLGLQEASEDGEGW